MSSLLTISWHVGKPVSVLSLFCSRGAYVSGVGIVIEKAFQSGRERVESLGIEVYAQARGASLKDGKVTLCWADITAILRLTESLRQGKPDNT